MRSQPFRFTPDGKQRATSTSKHLKDLIIFTALDALDLLAFGLCFLGLPTLHQPSAIRNMRKTKQKRLVFHALTRELQYALPTRWLSVCQTFFAVPVVRSCFTPSAAPTSQLSMWRTISPDSRSKTCVTPHGHASTGDHGSPSLSLTISLVVYVGGTPAVASPSDVCDESVRVDDSVMKPPARPQ